MPDLKIIKVSMVMDVEATLAALDLPPRAAGLVTLARMYARALDEADGSQNALKEIGPKLATVLVSLGAGKGLGPDPSALPVPSTSEPAVITAPAADPVEDEIARMRRRKAGA